MSYTVSMKDYEGMSGFDVMQPGQLDELNKALSAGYQNPRHDGGGALRVESLEATMRILTFSQEHIKLWREIPKLPAFSTSEEYTVQSSYGGEGGAFTSEGGLPSVQDASFERRVQLIKYLGVQKEVTHPMTLVRPAHGNVIALATQNGAIWLLQNVERALFRGKSSSIPVSWDGLDEQIQADANAPIVDLRGGPMTEEAIEEMANLIVQGYGVPTGLHAAPKCLSDFSKNFYARQRAGLPPGNDGLVGKAVNKFQSNAGIIPIKNNIFLRSGRVDGVKTAPVSATSPRSPSAPITAAYGTAAPNAASQFVAGDAGTYQYKVTAINQFGESAPLQEAGGVVVVAGDGVSLVITDGGGADTATGYRVYRSAPGGAAGTEQTMFEVPRVGVAATTTHVDLNANIPGTSRAYMVQMNLQSMSFRQLAPMMKIPLATQAASIRWMQLLYGTPIVYAPLKNGIFINIADA